MDATALSPVYLSTFGLRREPSRPPQDREPGYERSYDFDTLFYDVFLAHDGRSITAISPPLLNCESAVLSAEFRLTSDGEALHADHVMHKHGSMVLRLSLPSDIAPTSMHVTLNGISTTVTVSPSGCRQFVDRKVVYTMLKDEPLHWIADWATYNVRVHGADSVLIYDNGSTQYSVADLQRALGAVDGLQAVAIVRWTFPYGPGVGPNGEWDSNYCQARALEHARWRFCRTARAFLNSDVDELVVTATGQSVFERLASSDSPCLTYAGRWVSVMRPRWRAHASLIDYRTGTDINHSDCLYVEDEPPYQNKWIADPRACGSQGEWQTHTVLGMSGAGANAAFELKPTAADVEFRHCRQISTGWKYDRTGMPRLRAGTVFDWPFARACAHAFPHRRIFRNSGGPLRRFVDYLKQF